MKKCCQELINSLINEIDPKTDQYWYKSSIMVCLDPYSREEENAMERALEKVIDILKSKL